MNPASQRKILALFIIVMGFVSAFVITQYPLSAAVARSTIQSNFIDKVGSGFLAPACASSDNSRPDCQGSDAVIIIEWVGDSGCSGSVDVVVQIYNMSWGYITGSAGQNCSGSYGWSGAQDGTSYRYEVLYENPAYSFHTITSGTVTAPASCAYPYPTPAYPYPTPAYPYPTPAYPYPTPALPFNYTLSNSGPSAVAKTSGNAFTTNSITKTLNTGVTAPVTLSVSGHPSGVTYSISNQGCSPTCTSVITFTVTPSAPVGTYPITVTGSPLGKVTTFNLVITGSPMSVSCSGAPSSVLLGESVTWTASVSGGTPPFTYAWSGTNIPTTPPPSSNPYSLSYSTIGQKTASVTVTDTDSVIASCPTQAIQVNFNPKFEEF